MKKNFWTWLLHDKKRRKSSICMKVCLCIAVFLACGAFRSVYAQTEKLTLKRENASMLDIIFAVEKQSKMTFVYSMDAVNKIGKITIDVKDVLIDSVMNICLRKTDYTYTFEKNVVVIKKKAAEEVKGSTAVTPKKRVITGTITDKQEGKLPGVSVYVKGTTVGVVTDVNGVYKLELPATAKALLFSFVGMKTKEVELKDQTTINVVLEEEISDLDEVTVVAYGERKKRELIGAVSSVKAKDLEEVPSASLENLLQGHMAGVEVSNISGSPGGGGTRINIRGYNSLLSESQTDGTPLYVIDGVPVHSFTSPVTGTNTLAEIDPSTIESVEVLKDAASAALYGSRASNGVILITTKQGKTGRGKFSANVSYSYSILPETPTQTGGHLERIANLNKFRNLRAAYGSWQTGIYKMPESYRDAYHQNGAYDYFWNNGYPLTEYHIATAKPLQDSLNPFYNNSTNWWKYCFDAGKILNANLQASGGTETIKYMVGAGWYDETGIMLGSNFKRANILTNLNVVPRANLNIDARLYLAYTDRSRGAANTSFTNASKIEGLTVDPKSNLSILPGSGEIEKETLKQLNESSEKNITYRIRASLAVAYEFVKGLKLSSSLSMDFSEGKRNSFIPSYLDAVNNLSISTGSISSGTLFSNENLLVYNKSIRNNHNMEILLGLSYLREAKDQFSGSGKGSPSDKIHYVLDGFPTTYEEYGSVKSLQAYRSNFEEKIMLSYFGRAVYNYKKKYLFEFTLRRDGSSVFGEDVRWATFPSVAVGWAFSEEPFFKKWWLSYAKIRASWGTSGQQFRDAYLAHGTLEFANTFLGNAGVLPSQIVNKNLTWEESDQYDIGLDVDLFDYRLKFKLDYYYKYSKSLLFDISLPGNYYYHKTAWQNAMEISNEGIELELNYDILRDTKVKWRGKFNISRNWNRFEKSYTDMDMVNGNGQLVLGRPIYGLYIYKDLGIIESEKDIPAYYDQQGNKNTLHSMNKSYPYSVGTRMIQDMNQDGKIDDEDRYYAGSTLPVAYGGWANEIMWNGFDLNVLFTYSLGRKIINLYKISSLQGNSRTSTIFVDYANTTFWEKPGDKADYPVITSSEQGYIGQFGGDVSSNIEKVHYLRLKQLTLGYNFPKEWMKRINLEGCRLFFTAENLFLLTNYSGVDPEVVDPFTGYDNFLNYPLARKLTLGLTVRF